jgi:mono/diheme cytochrome c family protein
MPRLAAILAVVLVLLGIAGCGGSRSRSTTITLPTAPASGQAVFAARCSACHSLIGNESLRKQGGDLLGAKLTAPQLISFTRIMPAHLTEAQLLAVVRYILRRQATAAH